MFPLPEPREGSGYDALKAADAIHLATAVIWGAERFHTNNREGQQLARGNCNGWSAARIRYGGCLFSLGGLGPAPGVAYRGDERNARLIRYRRMSVGIVVE